jgi:hypothetical protein
MFVDSTTNATGWPYFKGSGDPGIFFIGGLTNKEEVMITTDVLNQNNDVGVEYMNLAINSTHYGMQGWGNSDINSIIYSALGREKVQIGTVLSLAGIYRGSGNDISPFVRIVEPVITTHLKHQDMFFYVDNRSGSFRVGENVIQAFQLDSCTVTYTGGSGLFNDREIVEQVRSDAVTVRGEVLRQTFAAGAGELTITIANSSHMFDTSNTITGLNTAQTVSTPVSVVANTYEVRAKAIVVEANTSSKVMRVERNSFNDFKYEPAPILRGEESGATANLMSISQNTASRVIGNNAIVSANANITNNTIQQLSIVSSGIGYELDEIVTLPNPSSPAKGATGVVVLNKQGIADGYWKENNSTTSGRKHLHDNHYYQEYSYEVQSGVDAASYTEIIENTVHVAGTRLIPAFQKIEQSNFFITQVAHDFVDDRVIRLELTTANGNFTVGANLSQGNTTGIITYFSNTLNKIEVANVVGTFVINQQVTDGTATANVSSTELVFL